MESNIERTQELQKEYIGFKFIYPKSLDFCSQNGFGTTLTATNGTWIAYFPKANFTISMSKRTGEILNICDGKNPEIEQELVL